MKVKKAVEEAAVGVSVRDSWDPNRASGGGGGKVRQVQGIFRSSIPRTFSLIGRLQGRQPSALPWLTAGRKYVTGVEERVAGLGDWSLAGPRPEELCEPSAKRT